MASAQASMKLFANAKIEMWDHDPGGTAAAVVTPDAGTTVRYVDMRDYNGFAVVAMATVLGGANMTLLEIVAADDAAGTNVTIVKTSGVLAADAVGDFACEECTAEEIAQLSEAAGYSLRYVAGRITCANAGDELVVTYIRHQPKFPASGLTADTIA